MDTCSELVRGTTLTLALSRERERGLDSRFRGNDGGLCMSYGISRSLNSYAMVENLLGPDFPTLWTPAPYRVRGGLFAEVTIFGVFWEL